MSRLSGMLDVVEPESLMSPKLRATLDFWMAHRQFYGLWPTTGEASLSLGVTRPGVQARVRRMMDAGWFGGGGVARGIHVTAAGRAAWIEGVMVVPVMAVGSGQLDSQPPSKTMREPRMEECEKR